MEAFRKKPASYQDLAALPETMVGQIIDGELIALPRPTLRHAAVTSNLGVELGGPFGRSRGGGPGGWLILDEPELHFGPDVLVPDLAGWRRERVPELPNEPYFTVYPDWVCEVLSPSTARIDRMQKMRAYARERVSHAWIIDPDARTLEVYERKESGWLQLAVYGEGKVRAPPFDAIELELAALWPETAT